MDVGVAVDLSADFAGEHVSVVSESVSYGGSAFSHILFTAD